MGGWVDPNCLAIDKIACEQRTAAPREFSPPDAAAIPGQASAPNFFAHIITQMFGHTSSPQLPNEIRIVIRPDG